MADAKISELTNAAALTGAEVAAIVQSATTKKESLTNILAWIVASTNVSEFTNDAGYTDDLTDAEIKTAYENNADTNAFTDADEAKLDGIEASATADQSDGEIKTAYENNADTNAFTDAEQTKLGDVNLFSVVNKTSTHTVLASETNTLFTNNGAVGAVTFDLPTAAAGLRYMFAIHAAQTLTIDAPSGATIRNAASVSADSGTLADNTKGNYVSLVALNGTEWFVETIVGTWTLT